MPNANIIAEELHNELEQARIDITNRSLSKGVKEQLLRRIRQLEAELDLPEAEQTPNYNGRHASQRGGD